MKINVPLNTKPAPIQWYVVKGFWKYTTENIRDVNFLRVTTSVTVKELHSVVKTKTARIQIYLGFVKEEYDG